MTGRHFPVRPDLEQLKHQAKDLLRAIHNAEPRAVEELRVFHPNPPEPSSSKLADAHLALARSYGIRSWPRLVLACRVTDAIWEDRRDDLRGLIAERPALLHEMARGTEKCNWGPPMSYAANLGRIETILMLHDIGAKDHAGALDRAVLQGQIETARLLHELLGRPTVSHRLLDGAAYTLSESGTAFALAAGASVVGSRGERLAPVDVVLESDSRKPDAKHAILEMYASHGVELPDTPAMALHRGRIDLLERHLVRDTGLLARTFRHEEIYPPELGCHDEVQATHGTPLNGATLLHMCVDYDEWDIALWLLNHGMNVDARAAVDGEGFGGHTALFATIVSQPNFWMNHLRRPDDARFTGLLLDRGADPNARASLRKQLHPGYGEDTLHEYRDVTPLGWGRRFHRPVFVSPAALSLVEARGGRE